MSDQRCHGRPQPQDPRLFGPDAVPALRSAAGDLSWLLERGYATPSALKIVGERYNLDARQRTAIAPVAAKPRPTRATHGAWRRPTWPGSMSRSTAYNLLTTIEAALGGGVVLLCRDGCHRDMAILHGSYRAVEETRPALELIGAALHRLGVERARFLLDSPVSNSGRLKGLMAGVAAEQNWAWDIDLPMNPDAALVRSAEIVISADSVILDAPVRWFDLAGEIVRHDVLEPWVVDLSG